MSQPRSVIISTSSLVWHSKTSLGIAWRIGDWIQPSRRGNEVPTLYRYWLGLLWFLLSAAFVNLPFITITAADEVSTLMHYYVITTTLVNEENCQHHEESINTGKRITNAMSVQSVCSDNGCSYSWQVQTTYNDHFVSVPALRWSGALHTS